MNFKQAIGLSLSVIITLSACSQNKTQTVSHLENQKTVTLDFQLTDFFEKDTLLEGCVNHTLSTLSPGEIVAQLIMPAVGKYGQEKALIERLTIEGKIGGVLMLNGSKNEFTNWISTFNTINDSLKRVPFLYSADAEPSLINRKITGTKTVQKANTLKSKEEVVACAETISDELNAIGINYNFAPVVDMSPNKTVGWRSFGHAPDSVIDWSNAFIQASQQQNILATAKHFPGHGFVTGDTHKKLVYIDGELKEIKNYPKLIDQGVMSIMIAHIAIKNNPTFNTNDLPSSISSKIVTELLRDSLNFQGLIVTDAMNMGGVSFIENANTKAIDAGCDILLMPLNAEKAHKELLDKYLTDSLFKEKVNLAAARILRAKYAAGLYNGTILMH
ncbi:MAG: glycoside hydrolase family 3 N-terminal domain-containing protein [Lishizhenia sp.]